MLSKLYTVLCLITFRYNLIKLREYADNLKLASLIIAVTKYRVFQKEIYNFERLHEIIQRKCTVF
jgi:hypothetical protein